jgi:hypothetical protein
MHGSRRGAIENTIRKQCTNLMRAPEPCGFCRAGGAFDPQREPLAQARTTPMLNRKSVAVSRPQGLPDLRKKRDRAQFVSFNFLNPLICTVASSARSHPPHTPARPVAHPSRSDRGRPRRAALADQGCAVLAALLAKGWRRWGLPSGAERKSNAHSEHFGS